MRTAKAAANHMSSAQGYGLIIADLDGEEAASRLREAGASCHGVRADVSPEGEVRAMAATCVDRFGGIDVLVNNAALMSTLRPFEDISSDERMKVMQVNTLGPFLCAKAVVPSMRERGGGRIVNISAWRMSGWRRYVILTIDRSLPVYLDSVVKLPLRRLAR
jgi:NAD(P)-dependent dehydrogenase (short-subunit alcohol dehydrogenase family)